MRWVRYAVATVAVVAAFWMMGFPAAAYAATGDRAAASEKCRGCHVNESKTWKESYHNKMVRSARDGLHPSALANWLRDAKGNAGPAKGNIDGSPYGLDAVVLVVGTRWKQRYLVRIPATGGHQFLDKQWNAYTKLWEVYTNSEDWETVCGACHTQPAGLADSVVKSAPVSAERGSPTARASLRPGITQQ